MNAITSLANYSWVIAPCGWVTLYKGNPAHHDTLCDGYVTGDPEETILKLIAENQRSKSPDPSTSHLSSCLMSVTRRGIGNGSTPIKSTTALSPLARLCLMVKPSG